MNIFRIVISIILILAEIFFMWKFLSFIDNNESRSKESDKKAGMYICIMVLIGTVLSIVQPFF